MNHLQLITTAYTEHLALPVYWEKAQMQSSVLGF